MGAWAETLTLGEMGFQGKGDGVTNGQSIQIAHGKD